MRKVRSKLYQNLPIIFSDEKKFTVDGGFNRQNDIVYACSRNEADRNGGIHGVSKYPVSVMVWCVLTVNGPTYIIEEKTQVNTEYYKNIEFYRLQNEKGRDFLVLINGFTNKMERLVTHQMYR